MCRDRGKYRRSGMIVVFGRENWGEEEKRGKVRSEKIEKRNMGEERLSRWSGLRREEKRE